MKKTSSILFLGDVVPYKPLRFRNNYNAIFNLECPITGRGDPAGSKINLRVEENHLSEIFGSRIFAVSLANNHILDYGETGLSNTIAELTKLNIQSFGLRDPVNNSFNPLVIDLKGIKLAFFAAVCSSTSPVNEKGRILVNRLEISELLLEVKKVKKTVDRLIIYLHWGVEESSHPSREEVMIARQLIEGAVDIVVGTHAHAPQAIEKFQQGIIAYNLGNFIMPQIKNLPTYFDNNGIALSAYNKRLMPWNRISWGLLVDFEAMNYKIKKYLLLSNRVIELPFTPLDRFINLNGRIIDDKNRDLIGKHIRRRMFYRKVFDLIYNPHIPNKLRKLL